MNFEEIIHLLSSQFGEDLFTVTNQKSNQPILHIPVSNLIEVGKFLHEDNRLYFDFLASITGIDNGQSKGTIEVIYHFVSIPHEHGFTLKVELARSFENNLPTIPTLSNIWKTADWHEREIYDLFGILFENHPDLRRILLPDDWQGYPLRKDYQEQELYHGLKVIY